jgi:hypothetical protein
LDPNKRQEDFFQNFILIIPESLCNFLFEERKVYAESLKFQAVKAVLSGSNQS